jgi:pilus assembly protein CpaE
MSQDLARAIAGNEAAGRSSRATVLAFVSDPVTEQVLRLGLVDFVAGEIDLRRGTIRTAIAAMAKLPTPEVLIVDLSGDPEPLQALHALADIVEPGVRVLGIGEIDDVDFYRQITRGVGVLEYIFKPITREAVARHFAPLISNKAIGNAATRGGRVIAVIGARGGVGATSIAANLAWHLGAVAKRHTVLVDTDLFMGSACPALGGKPRSGLRIALETQGRIDPILLELAVQPISERLNLLAAEEKFDEKLNYAPGAAGRLIDALRIRYNFIVLDLPFLPTELHRELLNFVHHRVIVLDPTLASVRDCLRLLALPNGPWQPQSPTLVLNHSNRAGGLTRKQMEEALKQKIHVTAPHLPKLFSEVPEHAQRAVGDRGPFSDMIIDLAHEIGFVGMPEQAGARDVSKSSVAGFFRRFGVNV